MAFNSFSDAPTQIHIGSGAAGITIAREFIGSSVRVCLLEAGSLNIDPEVADRSVIDDTGRPHPALDWRISSIDHEGVIKSQTLIAQEVGGTAFGQAALAD
jgi:choline dehydrogenase-like flavoprotein